MCIVLTTKQQPRFLTCVNAMLNKAGISFPCYDLLSPVTTSPKYTETNDSRRIKYFTIKTKYKQ